MLRRESVSRRLWRSSWKAISNLLLVMLVIQPVLARADDWGRHGRHHSSGVDVRIRAYNHHAVPRVLYAREREVFSPYFAGQVYYRPHHHYHIVYRFPVLVDGVVVYQPYYYCENRLFVAASVPVPRLAFGVEFGN